MSVMDRARALFKAKRAPELATNAITHDPVDDYVHDDLRKQAAKYRAATDRKPEIEAPDGTKTVLEHAPDLWRDSFAAYHNSAPDVRLTNKDELKPSHAIFREIMEHFVDTEDFRATKPNTRGDRLTAGLSAMAAQEVLEEELTQGALKEHAEQSQQMADAEQAAADAQAAIDGIRAAVQANGGQPQGTQVDDMKFAIQARQDAREQLEQLIEAQDGDAMSAAAAQATQRAASEANEIAQVWSSLPGNEHGQPQTLDPATAFKLALRWRDGDKLQRVALMVGRVKRDMRGARRKNIKGGRDERIGIRTGNDLSLLVPAQLASLAHPVLKRKFFKNYVDRSLLIYDTIGVEDAGRGPQVIARDISGSMNNGRDEWATAVCMAMIALAARDGRPSYVIDFERRVTKEWEFTGRTPDLLTMTNFASVASNGGGTDITTAVARGAAIIDRAPAFRKADLVIITDGGDSLGADDIALRDRLREQGVVIHGVSIGVLQNTYLDEMCDNAPLIVTDLSGPNDATKALAVATV